MNGEPDHVPPTGWQFKPDAATAASQPAAAVPATPPPTAPSQAATQQTPSAPAATPAAEAPAQPAAPSQTTADQAAPAAPIADALAQPAGQEPAPAATRPHPGVLEWSMSGAMASRPAGWFPMLVVATVAISAIIYFITRDFVAVGGIVIAALVFGYYNGREPQGVHYRLNSSGITIGRKQYAYDQFRSFAVDEDGHANHVVMLPLKRFMPTFSVQYPPEMESDIVALLADQLPMQAYRADLVDRFMNKIHF